MDVELVDLAASRNEAISPPPPSPGCVFPAWRRRCPNDFAGWENKCFRRCQGTVWNQISHCLVPFEERGGDSNQLVILQWRAHKSPDIHEYSSFGDGGESQTSEPSGCSFALPIFAQLPSQTNAGVTAFAGPADLDLIGNGPASIVDMVWKD